MHSKESYLVAVEREGKTRVRLYYTNTSGNRRFVTSTSAEYRPWYITTSQPGPSVACSATPMRGSHPLAWFCQARSFHDAAAFCGVNTALYWHSVSRNWLSHPDNDARLFDGVAFSAVKRLVFDIETTGLDPDTDRVFMFSYTDGVTEGIIEGDEREILERAAQIVQEIDPDIIDGYNIYRFDLPFLVRRAFIYGINIPWGRDGSTPYVATKRNCKLGGRSYSLCPVYVYGRQVVDTWVATLRYDTGGHMPGYNLKQVARYLGVSDPDRVYVEGEDIYRTYLEDPDTIREYSLQDVRETYRIGNIVFPALFTLCTFIPDSFQNITFMGTGDAVNTLLITSYLRENHSIPLPSPVEKYPGGYVSCPAPGLWKDVAKIDVESLYPSVICRYNIKPSTDTLDVFVATLDRFRQMRLHHKRRTGDAFSQSLQQSLKILINSFYGYMGTQGVNFNDWKAAAEVTARGREIVQTMVAEIEACGDNVIEVDTDGVYFSGTDPEKTLRRVQNALPDGIVAALDGTYSAMLSLKPKNYALLDMDGHIHLTGSALRNRSIETFIREFIYRCVEYIFQHGENDAAPHICNDYMEILSQIVSLQIKPSDMVRIIYVTETDGSRKPVLYYKSSAGSVYRNFVEDDETEEELENVDTYVYAQKLYKAVQRFFPVCPSLSFMVPEMERKWFEWFRIHTLGQSTLPVEDS